ncbi:MAG: SPOR domain-containing protein [Bacteroidaceae bacterium]|nr:SPOR domain-containing protein [Bacteroidales bacterium]MBO5263576.1 SPOR domain-containing protein [Bacteroidaceae bacterium]MBQ8257651.1 SPOR domain-containing protein [Bacteroidaceae bacterium]
MKRGIILLSIIFCALYAGAQNTIVQELQRDEPGKGTVRIHQPAQLDSLMGKVAVKTTQVEGYRVMVYSGNNSRTAREEANKWAQYMRENFPGAEVYVVFESPIRSCQYGDYRTREEAEAVMYKLKATRKFKEISVRKTLINLPY